MAVSKKKNTNSEGRNYYVAIACIAFIVIIVFLITNQNKNTAAYTATQADASGQAYYVADSAASVEEIMAKQAVAGHMKKVYTNTPITAYAYMRDD